MVLMFEIEKNTKKSDSVEPGSRSDKKNDDVNHKHVYSVHTEEGHTNGPLQHSTKNNTKIII